jgi:radical SAM protein with 4Fe4S-binding SPASM domain
MYFTEGRLRAYERMMQKKPKLEPTAQSVRDKNCKQCRYFDKCSGKCSKEKCVIPDY